MTEQAWANLTRLAKLAKQAGVPGSLGTIRADLYLRYLTGAYQNASDEDIIHDLVTNPTSDDGEDEDPGPDPEAQLNRKREAELGRITESDLNPADRPTPSDLVPADPGPPPGNPKPPSDDRIPQTPTPPAPRTPPTHQTSAGPPSQPKAEPRRPAAGYEIRVKLSTLIGLDDHPGEVPGSGSVHAFLARSIVAQQIRGRWRHAVCDDDGRLTVRASSTPAPPAPAATPHPPPAPSSRSAPHRPCSTSYATTTPRPDPGPRSSPTSSAGSRSTPTATTTPAGGHPTPGNAAT